jgi:hypothetical protein
MGILRETGETIARFGEIVINKTEELAKIAKLNVDIKRIQIDLNITEKELGRHVIAKIDQGATTIESSDPKVKELHEKVNSLKKKTEEKKSDIEKVRAEAKKKADLKADKKTDSGAQ